MSRNVSLALLVLTAIALGWAANDYHRLRTPPRPPEISAATPAVTTAAPANPVPHGADNLTCLSAKVNKDVGPFITRRDGKRALIASFLLETSPRPETLVIVDSLTVKADEVPGLVLSNLQLECDAGEFKLEVWDKAKRSWQFRRPPGTSSPKEYGPGQKILVNAYAVVDEATREGTHTTALRLMDWEARCQGNSIPFPATVVGQSLIVVP
jgi:hypothetical protein